MCEPVSDTSRLVGTARPVGTANVATVLRGSIAAVTATDTGYPVSSIQEAM